MQEMGWNFCRALVKFADPTIYRDALREVEERINGNQNQISKSNYSMQLDPLEKLHHGSSTSQHHPMILVAGSLSQKPRMVETSAYSRDKEGAAGTGFDLRKAQVK